MRLCRSQSEARSIQFTGRRGPHAARNVAWLLSARMEENVMMSLSRSWAFRLGTVAVAVALLLSQRAPCEGLAPAQFEKVKTLKDAVEVVKEKLKQDGKPEYAALLSETQVREAVRTAIKSYEALLEKAE